MRGEGKILFEFVGLYVGDRRPMRICEEAGERVLLVQYPNGGGWQRHISSNAEEAALSVFDAMLIQFPGGYFPNHGMAVGLSSLVDVEEAIKQRLESSQKGAGE